MEGKEKYRKEWKRRERDANGGEREGSDRKVMKGMEWEAGRVLQ